MLALESRVSFIGWDLAAYIKMVNYYERNKPLESIAIGYVEQRPDPFRPGWVQYDVRDVLTPSDSDYLKRTPGYVKMKPEFKHKIAEFESQTNLKPRVFSHCQPQDVLSGTDDRNGRSVEEFYHNTVTGSYNYFNRFFRLTSEEQWELVPWSVNDDTHNPQILAFGTEIQRRISSSRVLIAGAGGVGWKLSVDCALKGYNEGIADPDKIERSNLSRIAEHEAMIGSCKAQRLEELILQLRPNLIIESWSSKVQNVRPAQFKKYDAILVATDNVRSRKYLNRISLTYRIPSIQVGCSLENGRAVSCRTVLPGITPCYECYKEFTPEQMRRDHYTEQQLEWLQQHNYGIPERVPSVVDVNSIATGLAGDALFRVITNQQIVAQVYFDIKNMQLRISKSKRDPNCRACSNISDYDLTFLESGVTA
jgi:molybdopterin/thiamine biosynthesis adenylyltransferase